MDKVSCSEEEYDKRLLSSAMEEEDKSASGTLAKVIKDHQMMRNAKKSKKSKSTKSRHFTH